MKKQAKKTIAIVFLLVLCLLPLSCSIITGEAIGPRASDFLLSQIIIKLGQNNIVDEVAEEFSYDHNGRLVSIDHGDYGDASFEYSTDGLLVESHNQILGINLDYSYSYDNEGILASMAYNTSSGNVTENQRVEFVKDTQGRIAKGLYFNNEEQIGYITYVYDSKGNTTEIKYYANDGSTTIQVFRYDNQINPYPQGMSPNFVQKNNVVYARYETLEGSIIQEYSATFEYNLAGLPVKEIRINENGDNFTIEYVYISKK